MHHSMVFDKKYKLDENYKTGLKEKLKELNLNEKIEEEYKILDT